MEEIKKLFLEFVEERDWQQFHNPKNLSMCLACEAAELMELFQWLTPEEASSIMQDPSQAQAVREEIGDVMNNLIYLSSVLGIDPLAAAKEKIEINRKKYPASKWKGAHKKP